LWYLWVICSIPFDNPDCAVTIESVSFFIIAAFAVTSALLMALQRNPVMSAIYLIGNFFCIALLYLMLQAQLLAVLQVVVYTGAIIVLVIFVIMLLNLGNEEKLTERFDLKKAVSVVVVFGFLLEMLYLFGAKSNFPSLEMMHPESARIGTIEAMGEALFGKFILPFELTSILLLVAIVGAVILAKKNA